MSFYQTICSPSLCTGRGLGDEFELPKSCLMHYETEIMNNRILLMVDAPL
jgi:hypothetical protein